MTSNRDSGSAEIELINQLAQIVAANPFVRLTSYTEHDSRRDRSLVEREIHSLIGKVGVKRQFSLIEVVQLLAASYRSQQTTERLLIAPVNMLHSVPAGLQVRAIPDYLEEILRNTKHEVVLLAPFWDISTLLELLRCVPREASEADLVIMLVHMGRSSMSVEPLLTKICSVWPSTKVRAYFHLTKETRPANYPHAKCLVVDRHYGYLGSANFTERGMQGHFELGVALGPRESSTLGNILEHLWSKSGLFSLAWNTSGG